MLHVGIDIMYLSRLEGLEGRWDDPFFTRAFTGAERAMCLASPSPLRAFAEGFSGKEAVFKALGLPGDGVRLDQIEILRGESGQPTVELLEPLRSRAAAAGVRRVELSLSWERDLVAAAAVSE